MMISLYLGLTNRERPTRRNIRLPRETGAMDAALDSVLALLQYKSERGSTFAILAAILNLILFLIVHQPPRRDHVRRWMCMYSIPTPPRCIIQIRLVTCPLVGTFSRFGLHHSGQSLRPEVSLSTRKSADPGYTHCYKFSSSFSPLPSKMTIAKGVALVTGAAQGIGHAIALRLATDGYDIALNDLPAQEAVLGVTAGEVASRGRRVHCVLADVSSEKQVQTMVSDVVRVLGGLDVMVANAGIFLTKSFVETTAEDLDRVIGVNLRGTFLCYKYAGLQMIAQGRGGRIIGACSGSGKQGFASLSAYSSSKFGIRALTQCAALEFGAHAITVNAYSPGPVKTPLWDGLVAMAGAGIEDQYTKSTALGHIGLPADVAGLVSYLASKESHLLTGQSINIDGGRYFD